MKSENDRFAVVAKQMPEYDNKWWVHVTIWNKASWIPSFRDLFRVIQAICHCEDDKYPYGKGREMVKEFLIDACRDEVDWAELVEKYKIPIR